MMFQQRIMTVARLRNGSRNVKAGPSGANNAAAGPSGSNPSMQPPNQRNQQQQQQQQHHQQQQRGNKRNSTSPGEEVDFSVLSFETDAEPPPQHETLPRNDASPPDRKRVRRSPMGMDQQQQPLTSMSYPHPPPQGPGGPQQMSNNMIRGPMGGPPMNGFPHQPGLTGMGANPGMSMPMGQGMGVPQMGNAMSPGMNHPGSGGMMTPQMQVGGMFCAVICEVVIPLCLDAATPPCERSSVSAFDALNAQRWPSPRGSSQ
jgi:collagen type III alpha